MAVARSLRGRPDASPLLRSSHSGLRRPACNLVTRVTVDCKPPDHPSPIPSALGKTSDTDLFRIALKHREVTMRVRLIIGAVTLGAIACADRPGPSSGPLASRPFAGPSSQHLESVAERPFRELARVAPSHGGCVPQGCPRGPSCQARLGVVGQPAVSQSAGQSSTRGNRVQTRYLHVYRTGSLARRTRRLPDENPACPMVGHRSCEEPDCRRCTLRCG